MKTKSRRIAIVLSVALISVCTLFYLNKWVQKKGYTGLRQFVSVVSRNWSNSSEPKDAIAINIKDKDFKKLENARDRALALGVIVQEEDSYVPCEIVHNGKKYKAEIRLKGKMLDHVQGDKWSFRIKLKGNGAVLGMQRFSLQHPGTRNYIYDWVYHQLSKQEGITALNYMFINLQLNGSNLGVYALEENFAKELLEHNNQVEGPLFRFDPSLYWEFRVNELKGIKVNDEQTKFQSSYIEPFTKSHLFKNEKQKKYFEQALLLMEGFRTGTVKAKDALDISKFAKRHAILDLVGGHHSVDWSDVKFYYNPKSNKIEPISYESFSANTIFDLLGDFKANDQTENITDFHDALFNDHDFFRAYVTELERMSKTEFIVEFLKSIESALSDNLSVLYSEFPYKNFDDSYYYANANFIKKALNPQQLFHAYLGNSEEGKLKLLIGGIASLPAEVHKIIINDSIHIAIQKPLWIPCKGKDIYVDYKSYLVDTKGFQIKENDQIKLEYSVPGSGIKKQTIVNKERKLDPAEIQKNFMIEEANAASFDFCMVNEANKTVILKNGEWTISRNLIVPEGYSLQLYPGTKLSLNNYSKIVCKGAVIMKGSELDPIQITSSDSTGQGLIVLGNNSYSVLSHIKFSKIGYPRAGVFDQEACVNFYQSKVTMSSVEFSNMKSNALSLTSSYLTMTNTLFNEVNGNAICLHYVNSELFSTAFIGIRNNAIESEGTNGNLNNINANYVKGAFLEVYDGGSWYINQVRIKHAKNGIKANDGAKVKVVNLEAKDLKCILQADRKNKVFEGPTIEAESISMDDCKEVYKSDQASSIVIDGETQIPTKLKEKKNEK